MRLTEEQRILRDTAREVAQNLLAPHAAAWDREARFPQEALAELGRLGFMGMLVPPEYGGAGADHVGYALALEEIAAGDGATSTILSVNSLCCSVVQQYSSEEQKQRFLKPMAAGDMLAAFCLTEPQAGSDAAAIKTRARRQGNGIQYAASADKSGERRYRWRFDACTIRCINRDGRTLRF